MLLQRNKNILLNQIIGIDLETIKQSGCRMFQSSPSLPNVAVIYFRGHLGSPGITFSSSKPFIDEAFSQVKEAIVVQTLTEFCSSYHATPEYEMVSRQFKVSTIAYFLILFLSDIIYNQWWVLSLYSLLSLWAIPLILGAI